MEDLYMKENLSLQHDNTIKKSLKHPESTPREPLLKTQNMTASTPRQPLMDIKQVARPEDITVSSLPVKSVTPLGTPRPGLSRWKMKPSSLLKHTDKENMTSQNVNTKLSEESEGGMGSNSDNQKCTTEALREESDLVKADDIIPDSDQTVEYQASNDHIIGRHKLVSQFGDLSLNEGSLLGDSHYSDCNESFSESSKSEEELLASYVQTPNLCNKESNTGGIQEPEIRVSEFIDDQNSMETPHPTFLEKVAVLQRVRDATSSLASWVFSKETMQHHIQHLPSEEEVKLVHDVACSPIPQHREVLAIEQYSSVSEDENPVNVREHQADLQLSYSGNKSCSNGGNSEYRNGTPLEEVRTNIESAVDVVIGVLENTNKSTEDSMLDALPNVIESSPQTENMFCSDVIYSSKSVQVSDIPVQNDVETQSVTCSPIRSNNQDVFIQNNVGTRSMVCSEIHFPKHNVSTQSSVITQSVMCSPLHIPGNDVSVQNQVDTHSMMCSPIPVQVHDVSVQNQIDTHSVMCSPMVPCPTEDTCVQVPGPEVANVGMMTDVKYSTDIGIHVHPVMQTVYTEMEENPMVTTHTSMTPLKFNKKQGRKLTAEDVRKQHPRVLANELETLRLQNSRLESQIQNLEKDRKKLVVQEELQAKLEETLSTLHDKDSTQRQEELSWKTKLDAMETQIFDLKQEHEKQICAVRAEYETNEYRKHFLASQKLGQELQAELDQYSSLVHGIEKAHNLQVELEATVTKGFHGIKHKAEWIKQQDCDIQTKRYDLQIQLQGYNTDVQTLEQDKLAMQKERNQMSNIVQSCKENILEMDCQLEKANAELGATKETVLVMREEIDRFMEDKEELKSQNDQLMEQNNALQKKVEKMENEITELNSTIQQQEKQLDSFQKSVVEASDKYQSETTSYKAEQERKALMITNLERTLENRESEIDQLEKDLFECREIIYTQMEAAKTNEKNEKHMTAELQALRIECDTLKDCCANLRAKEQEARATLRSTHEELAGTQDFASRVMGRQRTNITECSSAITELIEHMTGILANLSRRAGIVDKSGDTKPAVPSNIKQNSDLDTKTARKSLVSQILHAADAQVEGDESTENSDSHQTALDGGIPQIVPTCKDEFSDKQATLDSPGAVSRKKLGFSGNSAFAPVCSSTMVQNLPHQNACDHSDMSNCVLQKILSKFEGLCSFGQEIELTSQVTKVTELFAEITRVAYLIEKALRSSLNDITSEKEDMSCRASQCEYSERRLQAELQVTQTELEKNRNTVDELNVTLQEMGEKFESMLDQEVEMKHVQIEVGRMRVKHEAVEAENELLNEQVTELLQKIEVMSGAGNSGMDVNSQREILTLKKKVDKYRSMLNEKDTMVEQISAKATSRIQKLEANWKKADQEVCRFDELVDIVRAVLVGHSTAMGDTQLVKLIELIDGRESLSAFKQTLKDGTLNC